MVVVSTDCETGLRSDPWMIARVLFGLFLFLGGGRLFVDSSVRRELWGEFGKGYFEGELGYGSLFLEIFLQNG